MPSLGQVLSYNLYTVLNIPHEPAALEEHFQDDDEGPVSNHGYMPYLNKYILDKVERQISPFASRFWGSSSKMTRLCIHATRGAILLRNAPLMVVSILLVGVLFFKKGLIPFLLYLTGQRGHV